jgi:hypothetical protein
MKRLIILCVILLASLAFVNAQTIADYTFSTFTNGTLTDMSSGTTTLLTGYSDSGVTPVTDFGFSFTFAEHHIRSFLPMQMA